VHYVKCDKKENKMLEAQIEGMDGAIFKIFNPFFKKISYSFDFSKRLVPWFNYCVGST
jgi:hypothetical protein